MKLFYLTGSIVLTVIILILGFGNITASCQQLYFFYTAVNNQIPVTFLVFAVAFIGIVAGFFYGAYIRALIASSGNEDDGDTL